MTMDKNLERNILKLRTLGHIKTNINKIIEN